MNDKSWQIWLRYKLSYHLSCANILSAVNMMALHITQLYCQAFSFVRIYQHFALQKQDLTITNKNSRVNTKSISLSDVEVLSGWSKGKTKHLMQVNCYHRMINPTFLNYRTDYFTTMQTCLVLVFLQYQMHSIETAGTTLII
jgi:hypothetical protein